MTDADPRLLSGVSARALWRTARAFFWGGFGLAFLSLPFVLAVAAADLYSQRLGVLTLVVLAADIVVVTIALLILVPRARSAQRRELDAGYTTLMPGFDQVDGIDPRTGRIVRPARTAPTGQSAGDSITTGLELGPLKTARTPLQVVIRRHIAVTAQLVSLFVLLGSVVFFVTMVLPADQFSEAGVLVLGLLAVAALCAVILIPTLTIRFAPGWYYEARLREATTGAEAFQVSLSSDDVVEEFAGVDAPALPESRWRPLSYVVCTDDRLVFYSRHGSELIPYLDIPKSRVVAARPRSATSPTLVLRKDNGTTIDLTLTVGVPSYRSGRKGQEERAGWILAWVHDRVPQTAVE